MQTYVQRDVRLFRNITNLAAFSRFVYLCANYAGQVLNRDELAKKTGVDTKTVLACLGLLESSYLILLLQPWYKNMNKRVMKSPKLYFYDTGLLCHLSGLKSISALKGSSAYGAIFENWIISEIRKNNENSGVNDRFYYFRDSAGNEVDLLIERNEEVLAVEINSGAKFNESILRGLKYWRKYHPENQGILVYGRSSDRILDERMSMLSWKQVTEL
ncbi:MAG: DUF4143 domain-containing protein [Bacteroidia bacterium]|nr:DUF4143 domain-containing protein [Bacteroidia bacterium]